jgi:hypothetical protein
MKMIGLDTVFIIGGAGITLGLLESVLRSMGKPELAGLINVLSIIIVGYYGLTMLDKLFLVMKGFL